MITFEKELVLFFIVVPAILGLIFLPLIENLFVKNKFLCVNYENNNIPQGMGLVFFIVLIPPVLATHFLPTILADTVSVQFFIATGLTFSGFLDDSLGNKGPKGFKGHFRLLFTKRELTAGVLKTLLIITYVLIILSFSQRTFAVLLLDTILIAAAANVFNLLDLRPGRAWKFFFLWFFIFLFFSSNPYLIIIIFPLLVIGLIYLPGELAKSYTMGDTGSNLLGGMTGYFMVINGSLQIKIIVILLFLLLHLYCENKSLSNKINKNSILSFFDKLGLKEN